MAKGHLSGCLGFFQFCFSFRGFNASRLINFTIVFRFPASVFMSVLGLIAVTIRLGIAAIFEAILIWLLLCASSVTWIILMVLRQITLQVGISVGIV